jgi:hypothetical protein
MSTISIIFGISLLTLFALGVIVKVVRDIGREMNGLGDEDKKTLKTIKKWRAGK